MAEEDKNSSPLDEGTEIIAHTAQTAYAKARNIRAVLLTALYNSVNTINSYYGNRYHFHLAEETRREMEETD